jgi:hypothetical protein
MHANLLLPCSLLCCALLCSLKLKPGKTDHDDNVNTN